MSNLIGKYSPWGRIDGSRKYARGVYFVSTSGHGGLAISKSQASRLFSESCLKLAAIVERDYVYFEEDCALALALTDSYTLFEMVKRVEPSLEYKALLRSAELWWPKYFCSHPDIKLTGNAETESLKCKCGYSVPF